MSELFRQRGHENSAEMPASVAERIHDKTRGSHMLALGLIGGAAVGGMVAYAIRRMKWNTDRTASAVAAARSEPEWRLEESSFRVMAKREPKAETVMQNSGPAAKSEPKMDYHR